ncbi:MAG TPA: GWxTD domain-containing protein [Acidobacteriaceae bacterium]|nr:GWxTD domain-containing protein [Acidobacteriaceae bacterium]
MQRFRLIVAGMCLAVFAGILPRSAAAQQTQAAPAATTSAAPATGTATASPAAQPSPSDQSSPDGVVKGPPTVEQPDPLKRQLSDAEKIRQNKALHQELSVEDKKWLNEDVVYIITDDEEKAFKSLSNEEERENFKEQFWLRRNPDPDSPDNEYRDEHYARIAYANEHFAAGVPGWRTDRGHMYIAYGKPDSIDSHPSGGQYERPLEEGGGNTSTFPFEIWHYRYIEGIGENIDIEFVDSCQCGDYHMTLDRSEKDALKHVPGAGATLYEEEGKSTKADRFSGGGLEQLGDGPLAPSENNKQFDRLEQYAKLNAPPAIKFKDLDAYISDHKILTGPPFPFDVRTDFVKVTNDTVLVPLTIQINNREITFNSKDGASIGTVNILGRVTSISGRVAQTFEDTVTVSSPDDLLEQKRSSASLYWKALPLRPGRYKVDIVIKDVNNTDKVGYWSRGMEVPKYDDDRLSASSLILANRMERVPSKQIGAGNFVIGNTFIWPSVSPNTITPVTFTRSQNLNFWMQIYNLGIDDKSKQNGATIQYVITNTATNASVLSLTELTNKLNPNADQVTLEKSMPLASLQPGKYQVSITVNDGVSNQQIAESADFVVE